MVEGAGVQLGFDSELSHSIEAGIILIAPRPTAELFPVVLSIDISGLGRQLIVNCITSIHVVRAVRLILAI